MMIFGSPDGKTVVMAAFKPYSARFREGLSEILAIDVATGVGHYRPVRPHRSLGIRGDDGPVWSPDGTRLAFMFASRLWAVEVDGAGMMRGEPKPITDEVTDAPTWSGDSSQLLYLSAGQFRLVSSQGGAARTIPHSLTWTAARPDACGTGPGRRSAAMSRSSWRARASPASSRAARVPRAPTPAGSTLRDRWSFPA